MCVQAAQPGQTRQGWWVIIGRAPAFCQQRIMPLMTKVCWTPAEAAGSWDAPQKSCGTLWRPYLGQGRSGDGSQSGRDIVNGRAVSRNDGQLDTCGIFSGNLTLFDECEIFCLFLGPSHSLKPMCNGSSPSGWRVRHFYVTCRHTPSRRTALCGGRSHSQRRRAMVSPALCRRGSVGRHGLLATMVYCHGNGMSWKCAFLGS